jgi:hypothetical protein
VCALLRRLALLVFSGYAREDRALPRTTIVFEGQREIMSDSNQTPTIKELSKPIDLQGALQEAIDILSQLGEVGVLLGEIALSYYGLERHTKDIDFAVTIQTTQKAERILLQNDLKPLRIGGVSFATSSGVRVGLIDRRVEYQDLFDEMLQAAKQSPQLKLGDRLIPVAPLPYLIACKLIADRPQDEVDLRFLLSLPTLEYAKTRELVQRFLGRFGAQYLDKLARAVGRTEPSKEYTPQDS